MRTMRPRHPNFQRKMPAPRPEIYERELREVLDALDDLENDLNPKDFAAAMDALVLVILRKVADARERALNHEAFLEQSFPDY